MYATAYYLLHSMLYNILIHVQMHIEQFPNEGDHWVTGKWDFLVWDFQSNHKVYLYNARSISPVTISPSTFTTKTFRLFL